MQENYSSIGIELQDQLNARLAEELPQFESKQGKYRMSIFIILVVCLEYSLY
jgi:hypothetical protein